MINRKFGGVVINFFQSIVAGIIFFFIRLTKFNSFRGKRIAACINKRLAIFQQATATHTYSWQKMAYFFNGFYPLLPPPAVRKIATGMKQRNDASLVFP